MTDVYALEVQTLFHDVPIGARQIVRDRARPRRALFVVGSTARAHAPVSPDYLVSLSPEKEEATGAAAATADNPLVTGGEDDGHYAVCLTPPMTVIGELADARPGDRAPGGAPGGRAQGATFTLRPGDRARVTCGAVTFLLASAPRAEAIPIPSPAFGWRTAELRYHLGAALAVTVALLALLAVPPDQRALALDLFERDHGWARWVIKPPVAAPIVPPPSAPAQAIGVGGPAASAHARAAIGTAGNATARAVHRRSAASGHAAPNDIPRTSPTPAEVAQLGVLSQLARAPSAQSIFERASAFGANADDIVGELVATTIGDAFGRGGLASIGTGARGGGERNGLLGGGGPLATIGKVGGGGGGPNGFDHGSKIGTLTARARPRPPEILTGTAQVTGALDRDIIRRIIRRHLNEVKFCYEQALATQPRLGGRILVRFAIAPTGQVLTSVVESSTLGSARVETCTAQAVRRWEFPRPVGGGLVMVSYPFVLAPAGAGD